MSGLPLYGIILSLVWILGRGNGQETDIGDLCYSRTFDC